jgi:ribulose-phosphate 3-epimerase
MAGVKLAPSMMCVDFLHVIQYLDIFIQQKIDYLHIDIMDGHYVPNLTFGPDFCRTLAGYAGIPLDIHLMVEQPDRFVSMFTFPDSVVSFHPETSYHPIRTIQLIRSMNMRPGIVLDPAMPLEQVRHLLPLVDLVCVMTVNPGYAGQKLVPGSISKIAELSETVDELGYQLEIEVDGNVSWENIPKMVGAGGEVLVAGTSSIFQKEGNIEDNIRAMRELVSRSS